MPSVVIPPCDEATACQSTNWACPQFSAASESAEFTSPCQLLGTSTFTR
jgi:hypothetical protein